MSRSILGRFSLLAVVLALTLSAADRAWAVQYPTLDPNYTQEIFTGPLVGGPGMAWTTSNALLTRNGSTILEYSLTQNTVYKSTNLHSSVASHFITGLSNTGYGMTNGLDGFIYTVTGAGLERFNPNNWAAPATLMPGSVGGQGYGVTTMPDGRIAYSDGTNNSSVWIYDPVAFTNTLIYSGTSLIDGMVAGPLGNIAITGQSNSTMTILDSFGNILNSFSTPHYPDGLAFSENALAARLYSNNNDGTITRYDFGPGFTGSPVITDIATGSGAYGDLAQVGPDCGFYVSQFENGSLHGATPGVGTNWDDLTTSSEASIIRIGGGIGPDGSATCEFYTPINHDVPEPSSMLLLAIGVVPFARIAMRRARRSA